jgi:hypothetical protein
VLACRAQNTYSRSAFLYGEIASRAGIKRGDETFMSTIASEREQVTDSRATTQHRRAAWNARLLMASLALYVAVNLADLISTYIGLQHGLHEGNPLMSHLLAGYGFGALTAYKVFVVGIVSCGVLLLRKAYPHVARITIVICNLLVACAVLLNIVQFLAIS